MTGPDRPARLSVRARLTAGVALLVLVALASAGLLLQVIGSALIDQRVARLGQQEVAEFSELQRIGSDPTTGRPITSVERLVRLYLQRNVPLSSEVLAGYWDSRLQVSSASTRAEPLLRSPELVEAVEARLDVGGSTTIPSRWGDVRLTVLPVRSAGPAGDTQALDRGAFVVALFLDDERAELRQLLTAYTAAALVALVLVTALAGWLAGRLLAPLRSLRDTAQEITETDLTRRIPERGNDDLTDLARTFNEMLDRLEHAFAGQRAFLDDAGHELRTPVTVLQGHLELLDPDDPVEVARTRELLLEETERMGRLVADLILLTKADRTEFVRPAEVDLARLTDTVHAKAQALGDRDWQVDSLASVDAWVDEQRITQAWLQLAHNAVKHTAPGDRITLGSAYDDRTDRVRLWVRDTGPGIPPEQRDRVFDRFVRLEEGRRPAAGAAGDRSDDGFGLGLSIVAAIARAHHGTVDVADAPGGGALVTLDLPRERTAHR